jgi:predicted nucleotidyltransferase component of viral defense system
MGETIVFTTNTNWLGVKFEGVKIDVLKYPYTLLNMPLEIDGIRLVSQADIAAMKLSAISSRGAKKDFIDLFFLLQTFTLPEMLEFYTLKFGIHEHFHVLRSLTYFEDAELEATPKMLKRVSWPKVKKAIEKEVRKYLI